MNHYPLLCPECGALTIVKTSLGAVRHRECLGNPSHRIVTEETIKRVRHRPLNKHELLRFRKELKGLFPQIEFPAL